MTDYDKLKFELERMLTKSWHADLMWLLETLVHNAAVMESYERTIGPMSYFDNIGNWQHITDINNSLEFSCEYGKLTLAIATNTLSFDVPTTTDANNERKFCQELNKALHSWEKSLNAAYEELVLCNEFDND